MTGVDSQVANGRFPAEVEIYTTPFCSYCFRALRLLKGKGARVTNRDVALHPGRRREMEERAGGGYTVPQIFINGIHIGGSDELAALERRGRLDELLELAP